MRGFKSFIAEAKTKSPEFKDYLIPIPHEEMLDRHLDFANHGIKLPDDPNLMQHTHNNKIVVQLHPDGGYTTHTKDNYMPGTYHVNSKGDTHREDGPAVIESKTGIHKWVTHGVEVARWTPPQPMGSHMSSGYVSHSAYGGYGEHHFTPEAFNEALAKHHPHFPPFDHTNVKTKWHGDDDEY